jgi:hypothetical protein
MTASTDRYQEDNFKLYGRAGQATNNSEYCKFCGAPIEFKLFEFCEIQRPNNLLSWKRIPIRKWWAAFDADSPNQKHQCNREQQKKNLQQGVVA